MITGLYLEGLRTKVIGCAAVVGLSMTINGARMRLQQSVVPEYCDRCTESAAECCCLATAVRYGCMSCEACGYDYTRLSGMAATRGYPAFSAPWLYGSIRLPCDLCSAAFKADMLIELVAAAVSYKK